MLRHYARSLLAVGIFFVLAFAGSTAFTSPAAAEILQISATGLVKRCPCTGESADEAEVNNGVLLPRNVDMRYFQPVALPHGQRVCSFSMIYHDINAADSMVARLKRKIFTAGNPPFNAPTVMAAVTSAAGTPNTVRKATDATIVNALINTASSFYFIEVDVATINMNLLGFQIDVRPTCP